MNNVTFNGTPSFHNTLSISKVLQSFYLIYRALIYYKYKVTDYNLNPQYSQSVTEYNIP